MAARSLVTTSGSLNLIQMPHRPLSNVTLLIMILIYGLQDHLDPVKAKLSDVIHDCLQATLGLPEGKRAHRFIPMTKDNFFYPRGHTGEPPLS